LDLASGKDGQWQPLAGGPRLQGLALVAYGDRLIRIGGFTAANALGEDHDLRSQTDVASFDPATGQWTSMASLPESRSSLDAAVIGDTVYVVGGWPVASNRLVVELERLVRNMAADRNAPV
jgi:N-acetylneuraminic acid mutarotase